MTTRLIYLTPNLNHNPGFADRNEIYETIDLIIILAVVLGEEEKSKIISKTKGYDLISPACLQWEIGNAFSACMKRERFELEQINVAWDAFCRIPIKLSNVDIPKSLKIAEQFKLYAYDCYYLQCALTHRISLFTLDGQMANVGKELKIKVMEV